MSAHSVRVHKKPHPKQADYGVLRPFQHVSVDTLGPFSPPALGGFKYAANFVDQQTKWKEVVLMKDKTCSVDALALFNKGLPSFPPVSASTASAVTRARSLRVLTSASTAKTLASSWSLRLRTPLSRSARTSVRAGRFEYCALPCLLYTSPSPRDRQKSRMPSSA